MTDNNSNIEHHHSVSAIFQAIDKNRDGRLTFSDLKLGFHELGIHISDEDLKLMMEEVI